jgi:peptidoglycan/LPS O-acetylase OafA/YrhL
VVAVPVLATCAVLAGGSVIQGTSLDAAYQVKPVQLVGLWSYSLYLWHWPLLVIPWERLGHAPTPMVRVLLVLAAVALSAATYYLVENPIRNMRFLRRHAVVSIALGLALIAVVVLVSVAAVISHPAIPAHTAF